MDFFARQDQARKKTKWLVLYFVTAVLLLIVAFYFVALVAFGAVALKQSHGFDAPALNLWNWKILLGSVAGVLAVVLGGSAYKTSELSAGGSAVATLMGGRLVNLTTADPNERKLLNVVEEMSIASGVPMPQVYVMEDERGINAFAAGHSTSDAAIGVTRGCIDLLSRDELQGVIGHEFSHILNGDMRLNIRLMGLIFGLLCLATIGRIMLSTRSSNSRDRNPLIFIGLALLVLGAIGVFFGRLIQAAVSRQREFLADASSVQFTRNPGGLSGALQKIGRYSYGSALESEHAPDMCHMFFSNGLSSSFSEIFATHPPIPERIRAIDPQWDGKYPELKDEQKETVKRAAVADFEKNLRRPPVTNLDAILGLAIATEKPVRPPVIRSETVMPRLGNPTPLHLKYAEELRDALPEELRAAVRDPLDATALIYALLLAADADLRATQVAEIERAISADVAKKTVALYPAVAGVVQRARLPLVNLALGALRQVTAKQYREFVAMLTWLIGSDDRVELFEFVLQKIIKQQLGAKFEPTGKSNIQYYTLKPLVPDCQLILSALARVGSPDPAACDHAFSVGVPFLRAPLDAPLTLLPVEQCGVEAIEAALNRLAVTVPIIKKNLLEACARVVGADGVILENEAELLRGVAAALDCPLPPLGVAEL